MALARFRAAEQAAPGGRPAGHGPAGRRAVRLTLWGMVWEQAVRAFWPLAAVLALGFSALALGLVAALPASVLPWAAGAWLLAVLLLAIRGGLRHRRIGEAAAVARVDARLPGRPLAALADHAAIGGEGALWRAHLAQMAARAASARAVPPDAGLARRDPLGLRLAALTLLAMALIFGGPAQFGQGMGAIAATLRPDSGPRTAAPAAPSWEGWAEPPAYTRRPVLYLNAHPEAEPLLLPEGSEVSFRLYGQGLALTQDIGAAVGNEPLAPRFAAERSGTIRIAGRSFAVEVQPDAAPVVRAGTPAQRRADGRMVQDYSAGDDHGIASGQALIALDLAAVDRRFGLAAAPEPREALALRLALPRGAGREVKARLTEDLARHPWANLPVSLTFEVTDGIGQTGQSEPLHLLLPGRRFFQPLAAALIELRRDILWSRENAGRSAEVLRALMWRPEGLVKPELRQQLLGAAVMLERAALTPEARDRLAEALWQAAVQLEDGGLADALEAMRQAQEKLSEAIRNGASPDEVQRLMDELKAATDAYMQMLAEQGESDPAERFDRGGQKGQTVTGDQIRQMMDEIQRLMDAGRMAEAQQLLDQFNRMMQNMQVRRTEGGEDGDAGAGQPGGRPMDRLAETLRKQQDLADDAFREMQRQFGGAPQDGTEGGGPGSEGSEGLAEDGLAGRQRGLREGLGQQRGLLPGQGSPQGDAAGQRLDEAGRAMQDAEKSLQEGDLPGAMERQADALQALREGMRALGEFQAEGRDRQGGDRQGEGSEGGQPDGPAGRRAVEGPAADGTIRHDPLGRELAGNGSTIGPGDPLAEGADPARRARDLQDEIRRRSGERARPEDERDYLGRLLDRF